jgi:hypothetical protein
MTSPTGPIRTISNFLRLRPQELLHHYTTSAGLIGIFESRTIWATSIHHLNDAEEYVHATKLLHDELEKRLKSETGSKKATFATWLNELMGEGKERAFGVSFSERSDDLGQWRAYANCDNAYAIAFDQKEMLAMLTDFDFALVKCVYSLEEQKQLLVHLVDYLYNYSLRETTLKGDRWWGWLGRTNRVVTSVLAAIKHPSFKEEREWRVVLPLSSRRQLSFRNGRFGIVPFYKIPLTTDPQNRLSFSQVTVGPTRDKQAAEFAVNELISCCGVPWKTPFETLVRHTETSLRS